MFEDRKVLNAACFQLQIWEASCHEGSGLYNLFKATCLLLSKLADLTFLARLFWYNHDVGTAAKSGILRHFIVAPP
jgi:hypothetical protein